MKSLFEHINTAESANKAIGHFNVATLDMVWAVFSAGRTVSKEIGEQVPIIIGTSEGERDFLGMNQIVSLVKSLRSEYDYPVFVNADHTYSIERACEAIDAGYDMVIIDAASEGHEENVRMTKAVVDYRNQKESKTLVEAELGFIGSGSDIKDAVPEGVSKETMTDPDEAKQFIQETGIDLLAPSIGNVHGMVRGGNPHLDPDRVTLVRKFSGVPIVLHGGSGATDDDFKAVIKAGVSVVHISTEIRVAYHTALKWELEKTEQLAPYKYLKKPQQAVTDLVADKVRLFWGVR